MFFVIWGLLQVASAQSTEQLYLIAPVSGTVLQSPFPIFNWSYTGCSGMLQLHIVEVKKQPNGTYEPLQTSVLANPAHHRAIVSGSFLYVYPATAPSFLGGKRYAWYLTCTGTEEGSLNYNTSDIFYFDVISSSNTKKEDFTRNFEGVFYYPSGNLSTIRTLYDNKKLPICLSGRITHIAEISVLNTNNLKSKEYTFEIISPTRAIFDMHKLPSAYTYTLGIEYIDGTVDTYRFVK
jgi:hypothetical protein